MNIKEAKKQVMHAVRAYLKQDELGRYIIPMHKQRPVFLMGPPGVGKTAIMEQVASELGIGLLSYSMTHHTRQSALGLPLIKQVTYQGKQYDVSEYTMSEIISSIHELIEQTGMKNGILFLDEINCVSETLSPIMLQFLQYKVFGKHTVPEGWVVVTAGNPPEYNQSVREYDIVTWDRLKRIDVEPDFEAWKEFAYLIGVHPAVLTYLEAKKGNFYQIHTTVDGKEFVTARGWDDLSQMMQLYEAEGIEVDGDLIRQYVQDKAIARDFGIYYDLFNKYKSAYQVDAILAGRASEETLERAKAAKFDERFSLLGLMLDSIMREMREVMEENDLLVELLAVLKTFKSQNAAGTAAPDVLMEQLMQEKQDFYDRGKAAKSLSDAQQRLYLRLIQILHEERSIILQAEAGQAFAAVKADFDDRVKRHSVKGQATNGRVSHVFQFCEKAFGEGQEILILVTELTANPYSARFIGKYYCKEYFDHDKSLLFSHRHKELLEAIDDLNL